MKESQLDNKTTIATNDYVRMVDENNNSVKIKKDSFMAAIRDALPSIISDGETNRGSVLSIINGAIKTRTDANLASVLGVVSKFPLYVSAKYNSSIYYNIDDATEPGMYWLKNATNNNPYGAGYEGILFVLNYDEKPCVFQIALRAGNDRGVIKYRWRNGSQTSWVDWKTLSTT